MASISFTNSNTGSYFLRTLLAIIISITLIVAGFSLGFGSDLSFFVAFSFLSLGILAIAGYNTGMGLVSWVIKRHKPPLHLPRGRLILSFIVLIIITLIFALCHYLNPPSSGNGDDFAGGITFIVLGLVYSFLFPLIIAVLSVVILSKFDSSNK